MRTAIQSFVIVACLSISMIALPHGPRSAEAARPAAVLPADMISPASDGGQCLTVDGANPATEPLVVLAACRGTPQQMWTHDSVSGKWTNGLNASYCLAADTNGLGGWNNNTPLRIALCTSAKALTIEPDATNSNVWRVAGTTLALDWGGSSVYSHHGGGTQQFSWLQPDLDIVDAQGCDIPYPILVTETEKYARELACDHVAKIQPPYFNANAVRDPSIWPGVIPVTATAVSRVVTFPLQFKDNDYLRTSWTPQNWKTTGLYAPAGAVVTITVSGADASEIDIYAQLGIHTDFLVLSKGPVRYPNVTNRVMLHPGENLVRSPYGGVIELVSRKSVDKTLDVTITGAVAAPHFVLSSTNAAEWNTQRGNPAPWAVIENDKAVLYVDSNTIRSHTFDEIHAVSDWYRTLVLNQEWLMGLDSADPLDIHKPPQGQHRFVDDIQISAGYGHSGYPIMANNWDLANPDTYRRAGGWGVLHELGHNNQMSPWAYVYGVESTVNLFSEHGFDAMWGTSRLVNDERFTEVLRDHLDNPAVTNKWDGVWTLLVFLDQIRLAFPNLNWDIWRQVYRTYRAMPADQWNAIDTEQKRYDTLMQILCDVTDTNLSSHFTTWMTPVGQSALAYCAAYPAPQRDISRIDNEKPLWYHAGSGSGGFIRESWSGIAGANVSDLTGNAAYPNSPSTSEVLTTSLTGVRDTSGSYGERLRAFLIPPVTGNYYFWLSGDDSAELRISSDENPANIATTFALTTATSDFESLELARQRTAPVSLVADRRYYIEVLHKENSGGGHVSVGWTVPASGALPAAPRRLIDAQYLSPYRTDTELQASFASGQPQKLRPGSDVVLEMRVFNNSSAPIRNVQIRSTIPSNFSISADNQNAWISGIRYVRFRALSEAGDRGDWASAAELGVLDENGAQLPKTGWTIHSCSSFQSSEPCGNAIDGDPNTLWHSPWGGVPGYPHEIQIDLGAVRRMTGFTYLPRQNGSNGRVGQYEFYVSEDGSDWRKVADGEFTDDSQLKTVMFSQEPRAFTALTTLTETIAANSSATARLILRAGSAATNGVYTLTTSLVAVEDGIGSRIYDSNTTNNAETMQFQISSDGAVNVMDTVGEGESRVFSLANLTIKDNAGGSAPGFLFVARWSTRPPDGPIGPGALPIWINIRTQDRVSARVSARARKASDYNASLTVCYSNSELPSGVVEADLALFQKVSGVWTNRGASSRDTAANCITADPVTSFGEWTICDPSKGCATSTPTYTPMISK